MIRFETFQNLNSTIYQVRATDKHKIESATFWQNWKQKSQPNWKVIIMDIILLLTSVCTTAEGQLLLGMSTTSFPAWPKAKNWTLLVDGTTPTLIRTSRGSCLPVIKRFFWSTTMKARSLSLPSVRPNLPTFEKQKTKIKSQDSRLFSLELNCYVWLNY